MPVEIIYTREPMGVMAIYSGDISGDDIIGLNDDVSGCEQCVYQLSDYRDVTNVSVTLPELHRIAIQDCSIPDHYKLRKMAMVGDKIKYKWLLDTYYVFSEIWVGKRRKYETETFDSIEMAYDWVGLAREDRTAGSV